MNETLRTIFERRSVRAFSDKAINDDDLSAVLKAACYAPSALNSQAWHFTALRSPEILAALNDAVKSTSDSATVERITKRGNGSFNFFYNAPVLVIVSCDAHKTPYPQADCSCALQNMFLAAHSLGIGSCWINQLTAHSFAPAIRNVLSAAGVPPQNTVYGCAALGYAAAVLPPKDRAKGTINIV